MSQSDKFSCAIVGSGGIAEIHAQAIADLGDRAMLVGVVDIDVERAHAFAERWGTRAFTSLGELLAEVRVDLAHLCTPPALHLRQAITCLERGVIPVVEKPPVLTLDELDRLREVEAASSVPVVAIFQQRFGSAAVTLRRWVADGRLGRSLVAQCSTLWYRDDDYFSVPWRGTWASEGGGPTMSHGVHQTDLLLSILGGWREVSAVAAHRLRDTETEDVAAALVTFDDGTIATVVNSVLSPRESSSLRFDFENATVEVEHLYGYTSADWRLTPAPGHDAIASAWAREVGDEASGHRAQFSAIYDALDRGERPPVSLESVSTTMELSAAIYASAFERRPISRAELAGMPAYRARMDGGVAPWTRTAARA